MRTAIKNEQKIGAANTNKVPNVKTPSTKPENEAKTEAVTKPSLEERIHKVEELRSLTMKRQRTVETLHNVRTFSFASDDSCVLTLKDSKGQSFETTNTNLITMLKDYLTSLLGEKVSALDDEILDFKL